MESEAADKNKTACTQYMLMISHHHDDLIMCYCFHNLVCGFTVTGVVNFKLSHVIFHSSSDIAYLTFQTNALRTKAVTHIVGSNRLSTSLNVF